MREVLSLLFEPYLKFMPEFWQKCHHATIKDMTHRKRPPDEKHTVSIFGNPLLIKWVGQIATPITPD